MPAWAEWIPLAVSIMTAVGAIVAIWYKRKQPVLDEAAAAHQLVSGDAVKNEIERTSKLFNARLNAARDLRLSDLEIWADKLRPVIWSIKDRDDAMCDALKVAYERLQMEMPDIPAFPEIPPFPPPRPLPDE